MSDLINVSSSNTPVSVTIDTGTPKVNVADLSAVTRIIINKVPPPTVNIWIGTEELGDGVTALGNDRYSFDGTQEYGTYVLKTNVDIPDGTNIETNLIIESVSAGEVKLQAIGTDAIERSIVGEFIESVVSSITPIDDPTLNYMPWSEATIDDALNSWVIVGMVTIDDGYYNTNGTADGLRINPVMGAIITGEPITLTLKDLSCKLSTAKTYISITRNGASPSDGIVLEPNLTQTPIDVPLTFIPAYDASSIRVLIGVERYPTAKLKDDFRVQINRNPSTTTYVKTEGTIRGLHTPSMNQDVGIFASADFVGVVNVGYVHK